MSPMKLQKPTTIVGLAVFVASSTTGTHLLSAAQPGPTLILEDSVVLRETDDHYIGQPISLIPVGDGSFLIGDGFANSVLHFDSRGRFQRAFGRKGHGPGEFRFVSPAGFVAGDLVGIGDDHARELELFELRSGRHIGAAKMSPRTLVDAYVVRGDTLWFAGIDTENWTTVGFARLDEVVGASSAGGDGSVLSPSQVGAPRPYIENDVVLGLLGNVLLDVDEAGLVVGFPASPYVLSASHSGEVLDSVVIPVARRRGIPAEDELLAFEPGPIETEIFGAVSYLLKVSRDTMGFVHALHQESEYDHEARQMRGTFFVSSVSEDGSRPCPDTLVPTSDAGLPELTLEGNRLHVLDQRLGGSGIRTVIRSFRIDPVNCTGQVVGR